MNRALNDQEQFWANKYAKNYIKKNSDFDNDLGAKAWQAMLENVNHDEISNYLECGCNIGRNIAQIQKVLPNAKPSIIEISQPAFRFVTSQYNLVHAYHGAILDSNFDENTFDLVFTMGVLIHINPDHLLEHLAKIFRYSSKYILLGEYFNRTPVSIEYQGETNKLFKRDFGRLFISNFAVNLVDYGFLWGYVYETGGFDDITWWLFKK